MAKAVLSPWPQPGVGRAASRMMQSSQRWLGQRRAATGELQNNPLPRNLEAQR